MRTPKAYRQDKETKGADAYSVTEDACAVVSPFEVPMNGESQPNGLHAWHVECEQQTRRMHARAHDSLTTVSGLLAR